MSWCQLGEKVVWGCLEQWVAGNECMRQGATYTPVLESYKEGQTDCLALLWGADHQQ